MYSSYNNSYFGFFLKGSSQNINGFLVDDIDLYHQPLQRPLVAVISFLIKSTIVLLGEYVQLRVLRLIKSENGIANKICRLYILALMILGPYWLVFSTTTDLIYPVNQVIGQWFCSFGWFFMNFCFTIVSFSSFIIALMRYFFIVWREKADTYRKEKVKKIFLFLSFIVPLIMTVWMVIDATEIDALSFVNKCYGIDHKVFLIEESTLNVSKRKFCTYEQYDELGYYGQIIALARHISCMTRTAVMIILCFNFTEGLIYYKIFTHMIR